MLTKDSATFRYICNRRNLDKLFEYELNVTYIMPLTQLDKLQC